MTFEIQKLLRNQINVFERMLIFKYANIGRRLVCAIKNFSRIRLARLSKKKIFLKSLFSFVIFNPAIPIFSFFIMLAACFLLSILFKRYI
jgi:hypothetical protein